LVRIAKLGLAQDLKIVQFIKIHKLVKAVLYQIALYLGTVMSEDGVEYNK